jgi:hypothetical protein
MAKLNKTVPAKTPIIPVTLITRPMMISFFAITDLPLRFGNHSSHKATSSAPPDAPLHSITTGRSVAFLVFMVSLAGCAGSVDLFKNSTILYHLDGKYQRLASCTYEHLARQQAQLSMIDLPEQQTVTIVFKAPQTYWELSFVNEDDGRQTRLEVTSGSFPSEHVLALARACAA